MGAAAENHRNRRAAHYRPRAADPVHNLLQPRAKLSRGKRAGHMITDPMRAPSHATCHPIGLASVECADGRRRSAAASVDLDEFRTQQKDLC